MGAPSAPRKTEAVSTALSEHGRSLRAFVRTRVPSSDVDDILQVAAMRAVERASSLDHPDRVLAWLYRLHRNVITDALRKRASQRRLADHAASAEPEEHCTTPVEDPCGCSVYQAKTMQSSYAEILELVDVDGRSLPEAAQLLGVSTNNATVRLHRARKALRTRLLEHCGVTNPRDCNSCKCIDDGCCAA